MHNKDFYFTIDQTSSAEFKDRGSKFIALAYPISVVEDVKPILLNLKKEHTKANHFCFAYRLGTEGMQFRSNDDGEPSGSAGKPILGQIDSKGVTNVLIVVVRYFGGTLLGVPGLINAYKTAAALCLQVVPIVQKAIEANYKIEFDYTNVNEVMQLLKLCDCTIQKQEMQLFCTINFGAPKTKVQELEFKAKNLFNITLSKL